MVQPVDHNAAYHFYSNPEPQQTPSASVHDGRSNARLDKDTQHQHHQHQRQAEGRECTLATARTAMHA